MSATRLCATRRNEEGYARDSGVDVEGYSQVHHARRWVLGLGANDRAFAVFERHWFGLNTG